jgi:hypothetical protein
MSIAPIFNVTLICIFTGDTVSSWHTHVDVSENWAVVGARYCFVCFFVFCLLTICPMTKVPEYALTCSFLVIRKSCRDGHDAVRLLHRYMSRFSQTGE